MISSDVKSTIHLFTYLYLFYCLEFPYSSLPLRNYHHLSKNAVIIKTPLKKAVIFDDLVEPPKSATFGRPAMLFLGMNLNVVFFFGMNKTFRTKLTIKSYQVSN